MFWTPFYSGPKFLGSKEFISCVPGHRARRVGGLSSGYMQPNDLTGRGTNRQETGLELGGTDCQATA